VIYSREVAAGLVELGLEAAGHQLPTSLEAVIALAEVVDVRQMGSVKHSQTVGRYAEAMGERLGMDRDAVQRLRLAGILHDIGKIGIPGAILSKTGPLSEEEAEEMRRHPEIGSRIARNASLDDIAEWIGSHHERPDGCGYPVGLRDVQIPLEAQILAVADTYEAMTNDRAYRSAIPPSQAIEELRGAAGSQFDVRVVDVFVSLLEDGALEALPAKAGV
jgi:putative nucleotidyltransferase with HDIG domain